MTGYAYESQLTRDARKAAGIYYTPPFVVEYMVEQTLGRVLERCASVEDVLRLRVCDPACGAGFFLTAALECIARWSQRSGVELSPVLRARIQKTCLFGADLDENALVLARLTLPNANFLHVDTLQSPTTWEPWSFDVVIGNPPYGAATNLKGDTARQFMHLAVRLLAPHGLHAFIVPKAFLHSSTWCETRQKFIPHITEIVDCGKVWRDVKLEQVIYFYGNMAEKSVSPSYRSCVRERQSIRFLGLLEKASCAEFGFALNGVSTADLALGRKLQGAGSRLSDHLFNRRGYRVQRQLESRGIPALGGKQIGRYAIASKPKGFVSALSGVERAQAGSILVQNIVAHVRHPVERLKIAATLVPVGSDFIVLDTVNQLRARHQLAPEFFLGLLNSKLISWYVYRFIVGRAIRTIHFDGPVTSRIPVPREISPRDHDELVELVQAMLRQPDLQTDRAIDEVVCRVFDLNKEEARTVRGDKTKSLPPV